MYSEQAIHATEKESRISPCNIPLKSEKEPDPKRVGTEAAPIAFPPSKPFPGTAASKSSFFKSFTK